MAVVTLSINGRPYEMACDDNQVARIQELGDEVDRRAKMLLKHLGGIPDARLLVMVSLMLADELSEAKSAVEADAVLAECIDSLAVRVESIADRMERS